VNDYMIYIGIICIPLLIAIVIVSSLPEVVQKNGVVRIGTIINKKYDLDYYNLVVQVEGRRPHKYMYRASSYKTYWCVCIYAYEKRNPTVAVGVHQLPASGSERGAERKKAKVEATIQS